MNSPTPNTQIYVGLSAFPQGQQEAIRTLWDRIHSLEGRPGDLGVNFRTNVNLGGVPGTGSKGLRITNAADPVNPGDYVTKRYADVVYAGQGLADQLKPGSPALANLPPLVSTVPLLVGTHAQRLAITTAPDLQLFLETDRDAVYYAISGGWQLLGNWLGDGGLIANRFSDLGQGDDGFRYWALDIDGVIFQWTGNVWRYAQGVLFGLFSGRPQIQATYPGLIMSATDMGFQAWVSDYSSASWLLLEGWGGPMQGTLSPDQKPTGLLTLNDAGFLFRATDFDRVYRWTGAGWEDAPGQPERGIIAYFGSGLTPGTGWAQCTGGTVTRSTSTGGIASFTTDNIPDQTFIRVVTGTSGGTGGSTTSGNESADQTVASGAGATVPAAPHTHSILPPFYNLRAYTRL